MDCFFRRFRRQSAYGTCSYLVTRSSCRGTYGGSVILAGIPSKIGNPRFLDFQYPCFPKQHFVPLLSFIPSAIAIIYTSLTTSRQIDLKKIIAYSSVAHMNLVTIGMFSRAAAVRSPIFSYGHTRQGQNMCAGRATHQPTSNGRKHSMSQHLIQGVSKTLPSVPKTKPLSAPGRGWGHPTRRQQQHRLYESAQALGQLSSLIHRSNALGSSHGWREKPKCSCVVVVRRLDAFPSLPGIVPHRKKERRAPARPVV
ncbi:hypothetical protein JHK86_057301 (mitochondrion) [Glycine max]|nr:hypothetical protein JHK86_057301 [Glycine max]